MGNKKRNALKHGANATEVMLWSERYEDYEHLRDGLYQEFSPSGSTEEYLVRTLLDLRWRRRRLECHEQIAIQQRLDKVHKENEYSDHVDNLRSFAPEFDEATSVEQVEAVLASLSPIYRNTIRNRWPFKTMKQMHSRLEPKLIDVSATKNLPAPGGKDSPSTE